MDKDLLDRIARIIFPYLKTKHKEKESHYIAMRILEEIDKDAPKWYTHG